MDSLLLPTRTIVMRIYLQCESLITKAQIITEHNVLSVFPSSEMKYFLGTTEHIVCRKMCSKKMKIG